MDRIDRLRKWETKYQIAADDYTAAESGSAKEEKALASMDRAYEQIVRIEEAIAHLGR